MLYEFWFIIDDIIFPAENFFSSQFHYPSLVMIVKKSFCEYLNPKLSIIIIILTDDA